LQRGQPRLPARPCVERAGLPLGPVGTERPTCWQCGGVSHLKTVCQKGYHPKACRGRGRPGSKKRVEAGNKKVLLPLHPLPCYTLSMLARKGDDSINAKAVQWTSHVLWSLTRGHYWKTPGQTSLHNCPRKNWPCPAAGIRGDLPYLEGSNSRVDPALAPSENLHVCSQGHWQVHSGAGCLVHPWWIQNMGHHVLWLGKEELALWLLGHNHIPLPTGRTHAKWYQLIYIHEIQLKNDKTFSKHETFIPLLHRFHFMRVINKQKQYRRVAIK
jgi:hypothetical protein